jgi:hypothetical protein
MSKLLVVVVSLCAGCVRAGFELASDGAHADRARSLDGVGKLADSTKPIADSDRPISSPKLVTAANDTCASPAAVDVSGLGKGAVVTLEISVAGAKKDYCQDAGVVDVVVRFTGSPGGPVLASCSKGPGNFAFWSPIPNACPPPPGAGGHSGSMPCGGGGWQSVMLVAGTSYLFICRDPNAGPATLVLK